MFAYQVGGFTYLNYVQGQYPNWTQWSVLSGSGRNLEIIFGFGQVGQTLG